MDFSDDDLMALWYLQRYGFLTIKQTVHAIDNNRSYQNIGRRLRQMASASLVGFFGGHRVGFSNIPKVYYLKKKGYQVLIDNDLPQELIGNFKEKSKPSWSSKTKHRIYLINVFLSLESGIRKIDQLDLVGVFLEYNRIKKGKDLASETTDFIADKKTAENKIVPDGAFIIESLKTGNKVLFLVEMDMGTEGIISRVSKNTNLPLYERIKKYDRYLMSGNYVRKYQEWGSFDNFILLFITLSEKRMEHIRGELFDLPDRLHQYYFFNTYDVVIKDFFNHQWKARSIKDDRGYSLLD